MRLRWFLTALIALLLLLLAACSRPPALPMRTIQLGGETYALPGAGDLVWTHTPEKIIWAERGRGSVIRATRRRPGGGPLTEGSRNVAPVAPGPGEGDPRSYRLVRMQAAADWLMYSMELTNPDQPVRRTIHLFLVNLKRPDGSQAIGSASITTPDRFLATLGSGYVVWQRYRPVGPGDRYTRGETHVFRLRDRREWRLPAAGWARVLHIEGDTLVLELRDGGTERLSLLRPEAPGEEEIIARADFDGDRREDLLLGRAGKGSSPSSMIGSDTRWHLWPGRSRRGNGASLAWIPPPGG